MGQFRLVMEDMDLRGNYMLFIQAVILSGPTNPEAMFILHRLLVLTASFTLAIAAQTPPMVLLKEIMSLL